MKQNKEILKVWNERTVRLKKWREEFRKAGIEEARGKLLLAEYKLRQSELSIDDKLHSTIGNLEWAWTRTKEAAANVILNRAGEIRADADTDFTNFCVDFNKAILKIHGKKMDMKWNGEYHLILGNGEEYRVDDEDN
jgi:hypothetical protein